MEYAADSSAHPRGTPLDPDAAVDYCIEWNPADRPWLGATEMISQSEWTIPAGVEIGDGVKAQATKAGSVVPPAPSIISNTCAVAWLWPATTAVVGQVYTIENTIRTSEGRKDSRSFTVQVANR